MLSNKYFNLFFLKGEQGDIFFMIEEGELVALKDSEPGKPPQEVFHYKPG